MEYIRRNSDYALRGLAYMSRYPVGRRFIIEEIATKQKVPKVFLRKIFQKLSKAKIVGSIRGIKGGFYLLKPSSKISIKEVLEAIQGPASLSECLFDLKVCGLSNGCEIRKGLKGIQKEINQLLEKTPLSDLI